MPAHADDAARLNFRLPRELKLLVELAAAQLGQNVRDFAIASLVTSARNVIADHDRTTLTIRDRNRFLAALDDPAAKPNAALRKAARRYARNRA
jgi:uncharacterized protein (DUF1778 family)